jgi:hypothetical protein
VDIFEMSFQAGEGFEICLGLLFFPSPKFWWRLDVAMEALSVARLACFLFLFYSPLMQVGCICIITGHLIGSPVFVPRLEGRPRCQLGQSLVQQIEIEVAEVHCCRTGRSSEGVRGCQQQGFLVIGLLILCEMSVKFSQIEEEEDLEYMLELLMLPHRLGAIEILH